MEIGVIGGGSVGLLLAALFSADGHDLTLYVKREKQKQALNENGLVFLPLNRKYTLEVKNISELTKKELLIICVKQQHLPELMPVLSTVNSPMLFLQNGMGHTELLVKLETEVPIFVGTVEHGAIRKNDFTVLHTGEGKVSVSYFKTDGSSADISLMRLKSDNFPIVMEKDWYKLLSHKLVINAVINPLTAIFDVNNGEIFINKELTYVASKITSEVCEILGLDYDFHWQRVQDIGRSTAYNTSSMRADIKNNRKTEIEYLAGFLLKKSETPKQYIDFTYHAVKAMEKEGLNR